MNIKLYPKLLATNTKHPASKRRHTPLGSLVPGSSRPLHNVMLQNVGHLHGMVDLHRGVDSDTGVVIEVPAGFLTGGQHHTDVAYRQNQVNIE